MKKFLSISKYILLLIIQIFFSFASFAQTENENGGSYPVNMNDAAHPCISAQQYAAIEKKLAENTKALHLEDKGSRITSTTLFNWPITMANGLNDCGYYIIYNYVDQDPTSGIKDYNCGTVTYDGHRGTDIGTAPYPFYKMDNNQVNVIAAAPGIIVQKSDGYFDKNCAMNTDTANYIIIQHADGSYALYWHMKKFSLTSKIVGNSVSTGEFLGVVGSSGDATGPHLHFEVWKTGTSSSVNDPYSGACNMLNPSTWWVSQKPYTEPAILKAQVNSSLVVLPPCPATETPNEDSCYTSGAAAKFYIFMRNETMGTTVNLSILNPDSSVFTSWIHNCTTNYLGSYWYWNKTLPIVKGTYTFSATYNGITCSKKFTVNCAVGITTISNLQNIKIFPNPAISALNIYMDDVENGNYIFFIKNLIGQQVLNTNAIIENNSIQKTIAIPELSGGIYFLEIMSEKNKITRKIFIKN